MSGDGNAADEVQRGADPEPFPLGASCVGVYAGKKTIHEFGDRRC